LDLTPESWWLLLGDLSNRTSRQVGWAPPGAMKYLVERGTDDRVAPPENGGLLKQGVGARVTLVSFPGAGHLFIVTEHEKAAADVVSFLHRLRT